MGQSASKADAYRTANDTSFLRGISSDLPKDTQAVVISIISAHNLPHLDTEGTLLPHPFVEISVSPPDRSLGDQRQKTPYKPNAINPKWFPASRFIVAVTSMASRIQLAVYSQGSELNGGLISCVFVDSELAAESIPLGTAFIQVAEIVNSRGPILLPLLDTQNLSDTGAKLEVMINRMDISQALSERQDVVYEYQRWQPILEWGSSYPGHLLVTDPSPWSDDKGSRYGEERDDVSHPLPEGWKIIQPFTVVPTEEDSDGWEYAFDFSSSDWYPTPQQYSYVRRRAWLQEATVSSAVTSPIFYNLPDSPVKPLQLPTLLAQANSNLIDNTKVYMLVELPHLLPDHMTTVCEICAEGGLSKPKISGVFGRHVALLSVNRAASITCADIASTLSPTAQRLMMLDDRAANDTCSFSAKEAITSERQRGHDGVLRLSSFTFDTTEESSWEGLDEGSIEVRVVISFSWGGMEHVSRYQTVQIAEKASIKWVDNVSEPVSLDNISNGMINVHIVTPDGDALGTATLNCTEASEPGGTEAVADMIHNDAIKGKFRVKCVYSQLCSRISSPIKLTEIVLHPSNDIRMDSVKKIAENLNLSVTLQGYNGSDGKENRLLTLSSCNNEGRTLQRLLDAAHATVGKF
mmetsp:Transcript_20396/g.29297  ORF Transcript_20396/g.29297 Transcript_20396/m.29297 type:complete len:635 (-) Transcript_20396:72-1976(-)